MRKKHKNWKHSNKKKIENCISKHNWKMEIFLMHILSEHMSELKAKSSPKRRNGYLCFMILEFQTHMKNKIYNNNFFFAAKSAQSLYEAKKKSSWHDSKKYVVEN